MSIGRMSALALLFIEVRLSMLYSAFKLIFNNLSVNDKFSITVKLIFQSRINTLL